jgi:hypothetical protein
MNFEWTDLTYQQILAGNTALLVFPLCVPLVFLVLSTQYESLLLPLAIILIVPMCLFSAITQPIGVGVGWCGTGCSKPLALGGPHNRHPMHGEHAGSWTSRLRDTKDAPWQERSGFCGLAKPCRAS